MAERTSGLLFVDPDLRVFIRDAQLRHIAAITGLKTKEDDANAAHLVACWNAIEAAGGDPAIVAEALDALEALYTTAMQYFGGHGEPAMARVLTALRRAERRT